MSSIQRTAVVTGATSERGIGLATARRYAEEGWAIVVLDLDGEKSAKVAAEIGNEFGVPAFGRDIDVADEQSVQRAHDAVAAEVAGRNLPAVGRSRTSPASPHRCRSSRPRSNCGTR
ncbi:hypothetical protein MLGJGCBP_03333 [Rhodococcus sp. T7]|nr:hypothetical protein MLGJGCBP_03333 [Rhodococcus sp. T7]